jgi:hypothetical protein
MVLGVVNQRSSLRGALFKCCTNVNIGYGEAFELPLHDAHHERCGHELVLAGLAQALNLAFL